MVDFTSELLQSSIGRPRDKKGGLTGRKGVRAADEAQETETKSWARWSRAPAAAAHWAGSHNWKVSIVFKLSVHTLCTGCALNFLTYFIHKKKCAFVYSHVIIVLNL